MDGDVIFAFAMLFGAIIFIGLIAIFLGGIFLIIRGLLTGNIKDVALGSLAIWLVNKLEDK